MHNCGSVKGTFQPSQKPSKFCSSACPQNRKTWNNCNRAWKRHVQLITVYKRSICDGKFSYQFATYLVFHSLCCDTSWVLTFYLQLKSCHLQWRKRRTKIQVYQKTFLLSTVTGFKYLPMARCHFPQSNIWLDKQFFTIQCGQTIAI